MPATPVPPPYIRETSFTDWEANHPGEPNPGTSLDTEFNAVQVSLTDTQARLAQIQRDDGALANDSVGPDQLDQTALDFIEAEMLAIKSQAVVARDESEAYASLASSSANSAASSATAAQGSAATVALSSARYCGSSAVAPNTRLNGSALVEGDEYQNTADNLRYNWTGSAWVALNSSAQSLEEKLANATDPAKGAAVIGTLKMAALPGNDFSQALITGFYSGTGDGAGGLSSANAPVGSGNVKLDTVVLRGASSITQAAFAAGSESAKIWFRSGFVTSGNYAAALAAAPWKSLPTLQGNAVFRDLATAVKSTIYIEHYGDGTGASSQTYGLDIHNYPNAKSGLVLHQYSNNDPAFWLDNTDNAPAIRINNTHNFTLNPAGPNPTSLGDFQTWDTELVPKLRLKCNYVFEAYQVTPSFYRSEGTALSAQTPVGVAASTMTVVRAHNANAGAALSVTNSGGSGVSINQTGPGVGIAVSLQVGAAGFYAGQLAGNDYGAQVTTSADSGISLDVKKNGTGAGEAVRITNAGTGVSLSVRDGAAEVMGIAPDGKLKWSTATNVQTTVGAAGAAAAPPATPSKYLKVIGDNGLTYVIPAYLAS